MFLVFIKIFVSADHSLAKYTGDSCPAHHVFTVCELAVNCNNFRRKQSFQSSSSEIRASKFLFHLNHKRRKNVSIHRLRIAWFCLDGCLCQPPKPKLKKSKRIFLFFGENKNIFKLQECPELFYCFEHFFFDKNEK